MRSARSGAVMFATGALSDLTDAVACSLSVKVFHATSCADDRPSLSCSAAWRFAMCSADFPSCEPNAPQWELSPGDAATALDVATPPVTSASDATAMAMLLRTA